MSRPFSPLSYHSKIFSVLLGVLALSWVVWKVVPSHNDLIFAQLAAQGQQNLSSRQIFQTAQQERKGVVKELWFSQEDHSRLHYRIASESSVLTLKPEEKKWDLIEKLENLQCWMQDKLYDPTVQNVGGQQVRFLRAAEGVYHFSSQEFFAQSVALSLYRLDGQVLPKEFGGQKPFLHGVAEDVSFAISDHQPRFNARFFKADIHSASVGS